MEMPKKQGQRNMVKQKASVSSEALEDREDLTPDRQRTSSSPPQSRSSKVGRCLTGDRTKMWYESLKELKDFKEEHGHFTVPSHRPLFRWVCNQRRNYKRKKENRQSTMTDDRIIALEEIGFAWNPRSPQARAVVWERRFDELKAFKLRTGHCNVSQSSWFSGHYAPLARWVGKQRAQYRKLVKGAQSSLTTERISKLQEIGFSWDWKAIIVP